MVVDISKKSIYNELSLSQPNFENGPIVHFWGEIFKIQNEL